MDDTVVITLFRHGLTEGNKKKAYMGWNDSPLSEEAISQVSSYRLHSKAYDVFVSSDLNRCLQTMKLLFPDVMPEVLPELREMHFGSFQGRTYDELKEEEHYQRWLEDSFSVSPPGGESFSDFSKRINLGWEKIKQRILAQDARRPFIVTHGGVIKYLLTKYAPDEKSFWDWKISHGKGYELLFELEQIRRGSRCISLREVPLTERENG